MAIRPSNLKGSLARMRELIVLLHSEPLRLHLKNSAHLWASCFKKDVGKRKCVQRNDQDSENPGIVLEKRRQERHRC